MLAMIAGLPPAGLLVAVLGTVVTLTVLQERRTQVPVVAPVS